MFMNKIKKIVLIIYVLLFSYIIYDIYNYNKIISLKLERYSYKDNNPILLINKIIIIGDSRMDLINSKREKLNIPSSIDFIAKSGARIDWLYNTGFPELKKKLKDSNKYKYHIVFNLGVNDLNSDTSATKLARNYYTIYKKIIEQNNNVSFYFLSVNPIDEDRIFKYFSPYNKRSNERIEEFNKYFISKLNELKLYNVQYCDSYNNLNFYLPDGLHYDTKTDEKIINFIINNCVKINNQINLTS